MGKGRYHFLQELDEHTLDQLFGGKGKSRGKGKSSAKGFGRKQNPRGRDGQVLRCDVPLANGQPCNSESHLRADHHRFVNTSGFQALGTSTPFVTSTPGPLDDLLGGMYPSWMPAQEAHPPWPAQVADQ